ncbi:MAG: MmcQ/YjbR family DNA-binding protein [Clostridiales bacterium]|nr:MmcQ/YjbR family DNA-binding protein [Clostridiales bacterium]
MSKIENTTVSLPKGFMRTYQWIDACFLAQPGTEKEFNPAWKAYKYMLKNKMYAYIGIQDKTNRPIVTLKLEPLYSDMLRSQYTDIVAGYYMNKVHWSTIYLDGNVPKEVITDSISASYHVLFSSLSKKIQKELSSHNIP